MLQQRKETKMTRKEAENIDLVNCTNEEYEEWLTVWRPIFEEEWQDFQNRMILDTMKGYSYEERIQRIS